jgi:hypothetical protein
MIANNHTGIEPVNTLEITNIKNNLCSNNRGKIAYGSANGFYSKLLMSQIASKISV